MGIITIDESFCENGCNLELKPFMVDLFVILTTFLIDTFVIFCLFKQCQKKIIRNDEDISGRNLKPYNPCNQHYIDIPKHIEFNSKMSLSINKFADKSSIVSIHTIDISVISLIAKVTFNNQILPSIHQWELICCVDYLFKQCQKKIIRNDEDISGRNLKPYNPCKQRYIDIPKHIESNSKMSLFINRFADKSSIVSIHTIDISAISLIEIAKFNNQILPSIHQRKLICCVDGSYSPRMEIGHSGFRASDGSSIARPYSPQCPKRGSTETEVFAARLAIQYAFRNCYNTLIIHTDNSKVEQRLRRPKNKDNDEYPVFCQTLNQYRQQNGNHAIRVERVRGHTTRFEQKQCKIKHEFAKTDRLVRRKNRQYIKRWRIRYAQAYISFNQYNNFFSDNWTVYRYLVYHF